MKSVVIYIDVTQVFWTYGTFKKDVQTPLLMLPPYPNIKVHDAIPNPCLNPTKGRGILMHIFH